MTPQADRPAGTSGIIRGPQNLVAGLALMALAAYAFYLTRDLPQGTLRAMGPAMLPRWLAIGVGICGFFLAAAAFVKRGDPLRVSDYSPFLALAAVLVSSYLISSVLGVPYFLVVFAVVVVLVVVVGVMALSRHDLLEASGLRGAFFVSVGVLTFFLTIRGQSFGPLNIPQLGLIAAGPLAIFVGGYATPDVRWRDLLILAFALTAGCMILFGDLLNLPIPLYPQWMSDLYPVGWSNDARMRTTAGALIVLAVLVYLLAPRHREREPVDVVPNEHAGVV